MKNIIVSLLMLASLVAMPASAATVVDPMEAQIAKRVAEMQFAASNSTGRWQVYTSEQRNAERVADVAKMNNVSLEKAAKIVYRGWHSQNAMLGRSPIWPIAGLAFRPLVGGWVNAYSITQAYAGYDPLTGVHVTTAAQRDEVRDDNFWYCPVGQTYTYSIASSECK